MCKSPHFPADRSIHGIPLEHEISYINALEHLVIPEHVERMRVAIDTAVKVNGRFNEDYQIQPMDGSTRK